VQAHIDLRYPTVSVGIHWGTFMMSNENYLDPPRKLREAWTKVEETVLQERGASSVGNTQFTVVNLGETLVVA
jgi:N-acyl-phosphatidylethanolamine-hydrolysing phospholipase D